ncbi:DUF2238 domain-containing protein [Chitiniphilus eburneus]|uniref:DUF2238 domain-containing protein n=1 Tax=Chitiniphilus eburneus TaxID=2571148 RepID=A0A4U0Q197_9NEIS|nr:DUF2238 domain-containing protein [Chitiniphilus eburneus]TJZ74761.1 DUF2238 domain-containing protein [Chitiniphilus eburneus]
MKLPTLLLALVVAALIASGIAPTDRLTWWMEVLPVLIAIPVLIATRHAFPLTPLLYVLIALHALILIYGGTYTYAHVPLGFWMEDWFGLTRNPYDKIGHFAQGFVPVLIAREILLRGRFLNHRHRLMASFLSGCVAMAISAVYELVEWGAAVIMGQGADEFLGTQGYEWDTQSDMGFALLGAVVALLLLSRWHDRQMARQTVKPV